MVRLSQFLSLLLLVLWLPSTQHCALESVGIVAASCTEPCSERLDNCGVIEEGAYHVGATAVQAQAPALIAGLAHFCSAVTATEPSGAPGTSVRPPEKPPSDWVLTWQFVRRAAPSPRAPSLLCS